MERFTINERLAEDSVLVACLGLCQIRLSRDARWPWLIAVPQRQDVEEIFDLTPLDQTMLTFEINEAAAALKQMTGAEKINIAAIGNIVRQLHVHIVARFEGDTNWPGPIWGYGEAKARAPEDMDALSRQFLEALSSK
ncbi:HIT domain-containing protein [Martelella alba]|uniref:HIT domain-containing protein n=1 Tax=Martelella alba TaxID=2590451 RepID=A0A506UCT6_9HYPH|nr:HIT family protein [Martelella alba]TPW30774.1 HIT domain-containing protein [Martelella alba]